jgi:serine/threonine-protein kinase
MAKDPAARYQTADDFIADLQSARDAPYEAAMFAPAPPVEVVEEHEPRDRRWLWWLLALLALAAIAIGAYLLLKPKTDTVPDVVGKPSAIASQILQNRGFEVNIQTVVNPAVPRDTVATQNPQPGAEAKVGSTVTIIVSSGPGEAAVPAVVGLPRSQAEKKVRDAGFKVSVTQEYSADVPKDQVMTTTPQEGTTAEKGTTVRLTVSKGPKPVKVPDVTGKDIDVATGQLEGMGLKVTTQDDTSTTKPLNTVTSQEPAAGTELKPGDTVTLKVAKPIDVPDVTGQTESQARSTLVNAGFHVKATKVDTADETQKGKVVDQTPAGGAKRKRGTTIEIKVGHFKASATPTPTPTIAAPTPTATATP